MASQPRFIGGRKWLIGVPLGPFGYFRSPDSGPIPIFQTVSEGVFSEVRGDGVLRSCPFVGEWSVVNSAAYAVFSRVSSGYHG